MKNKALVLLIGVVALITIVCAIIFIGKGSKDSGSGDNEMYGNYKLTLYKADHKEYKPDELKTDLGKKIEVEVSKDNIIVKTTYYSTDGQSSTVNEKFTYDKENLFDESDKTLSVYKYMYGDGDFALFDLNNEIIMEFTKK